MENTSRLDNYLALLKIRQAAYRRNTLIAGGLQMFALLATTGMLLLTEWNVRSIWLMGLLDVVFILSFLMAWVRLEIAKNNIELLNNL